jgi:branched-chain amino acid aminotransferase
MTIDLAAKLDIPCQEQDLDPFDAETADEMFLTSTSLCIMPVRRFNGGTIADGDVPGPVTARLMAAYSKEVGCDFVQQYLDRLE